MSRGYLITVEGIEGAGKTTALNVVKQFLDAREIDYFVTREPGGTALAEKIREILLHPFFKDEAITLDSELLLMFAARSQHIEHVIKPKLNQGQWVISDRFIDASYAYQGGGRGMNISHILYLDQWIVNGAYPDLTLLLDVPSIVGLNRTEQRGQERDRIEKESNRFFDKVRYVYLDRAAKHAERIKVIDAAQPLQMVAQQIEKNLLSFYEAKQS